MKKLTYVAGGNGLPTDIANVSDTIYATVITTTNVAETVTVPAGAKLVLFQSDGAFYARFGTGNTAVAPAADVADGTASEYSPTSSSLAGITAFSLVSVTAGRVIIMRFYS